MFVPGKIINASQKLINKMYKKVSGTSITLSNAAKSKLHGLTVDGKAVQDGTPTPSSPVPVEVVEPVDGVFGISIDGVVTPIDLQGNVLASLPDGTKDVLTVDSTGAVTLEKRVGVVTLNGSETWLAYSSWDGNGQYCYYTKINSAPTNIGNAHPPICDFATSYTLSGFSVNTKPVDACCFDNSSNFCVRVPDSTSSDFKTWLTSNNQNVYYYLATPQTIGLGTIDMPQIKDNSNISIIATVSSDIEVEYKKDLIYVSAYN